MNMLTHFKHEIIKAFVFLAIFIFILVFALGAKGNSDISANIKLKIVDSAACEELGESLFSDVRFSSPDGRISGLKKDENTQFQLSCKTCHMVDEKLKEKGMRGYTDFSKRSKIPFRTGDSEPYQFTHRRTQQLINISGTGIASSPVYHWDGEFQTGNEHEALLTLIKTTFVSRNMGWREGEEEKANAIRLRFILDEEKIAASRTDKAEMEPKPTYVEFYCKSFGLTREEFFKLSQEEILYLCNEAIALYIENIKSDVESSFDIFLKENGAENLFEADSEMLKQLIQKKDLKFINKLIPVPDSEIKTSRRVKFGEKEFEGLKLFMNENKTNCASCHTPPSFTDNKFYNIGVSETDYMDIHGNLPGEFYNQENLQRIINSSDLKSLKKRFQVFPSKNNSESIDLGRALFFKDISGLIAAFRTPTLRNLEFSNPYLHSGRAETIKEAILLHTVSAGHKKELKFVSSKLKELKLSEKEINLLVAFLNSLNDHYE